MSLIAGSQSFSAELQYPTLAGPGRAAPSHPTMAQAPRFATMGAVPAGLGQDDDSDDEGSVTGALGQLKWILLIGFLAWGAWQVKKAAPSAIGRFDDFQKKRKASKLAELRAKAASLEAGG